MLNLIMRAYYISITVVLCRIIETIKPIHAAVEVKKQEM